MLKDKEVLVEPGLDAERIEGFIAEAHSLGVKRFLSPPPRERTPGVEILAKSPSADVFVCSDLREAEGIRKPFALSIKVRGRADIERIVQAAKIGAESVIIETCDWRIIPLENIIAELHKSGTKVYARVKGAEETRTMFSVLELGVDGVVLTTGDIDEVRRAMGYLQSLGKIELKYARVTEIRDVGVGERACVDTASILNSGEGMLIGSKSNFLFLIHNESAGSQFTSPRPFRVNAGSIHSYMLTPSGRTKYLSEAEAGDEVLVVSSSGEARSAVVGRVKIERRPLALVKAEAEGEVGNILVQKAETIRFVGRSGTIPVTEVKVGDEVLVRVLQPTGRHFGVEVGEYILEK